MRGLTCVLLLGLLVAGSCRQLRGNLPPGGQPTARVCIYCNGSNRKTFTSWPSSSKVQCQYRGEPVDMANVNAADWVSDEEDNGCPLRIGYNNVDYTLKYARYACGQDPPTECL